MESYRDGLNGFPSLFHSVHFIVGRNEDFAGAVRTLPVSFFGGDAGSKSTSASDEFRSRMFAGFRRCGFFPVAASSLIFQRKEMSPGCRVSADSLTWLSLTWSRRRIKNGDRRTREKDSRCRREYSLSAFLLPLIKRIRFCKSGRNIRGSAFESKRRISMKILLVRSFVISISPLLISGNNLPTNNIIG